MIRKSENEKALRAEKKNHNLLILGVLAIGIAITTTTVSLKSYHDSGDIYLDRSRPGFLPDEQEVEEQQERKRDFVFSAEGGLDAEVIDEYLENYKQQLDELDRLEKPFSSKPLSDESLGLTAEAQTKEPAEATADDI